MEAKLMYDLLQRFGYLGATAYAIQTGNLNAQEESIVYQTTRPCILNIEFSTNHASGNLRIRPYRSGIAIITNGINSDGTGTTVHSPSDINLHQKRNIYVLNGDIANGKFKAVMEGLDYPEGVIISRRNLATATIVAVALLVEGRVF